MRLTNDMRSLLRKKLVTHRFSNQVLTICSDSAQLAVDVYEDLFSVATRIKLAEVPEGWLPKSSTIKAQFGASGSDVCDYAFNGANWVYGAPARAVSGDTYREVKDTVAVVMPANKKDAVVKVYEVGHALSIRHEDLKARKEACTKAIEAAERQIDQTLDKFTTLKALLRDWPEVEPFVQSLGWTAEKPRLPAVPVKTLNQLLDLPLEGQTIQ